MRPLYPGGIWMLKKERLIPVYKGNGVFGLCWGGDREILLGVTRSSETPILAFRLYETVFGTRHTSLPVEYKNYIQAMAAHGCWVWNNKIFVVAAQGDPDAAICANDDFKEHHVGKVIISNIKIEDDRVIISDSRIWNPFECDHHHHYNDILVNDEYIYLSSFSTCDLNKKYSEKGAVSRFRHDFSLERIITDELDAPHSVILLDHHLYVCSSRTSSIISVDLGDKNTCAKLQYKGIDNFIRGLFVTPDYFLIGLSKSSGRSNSAHLINPLNGILKYNRNTGEALKIAMPSNCDNVYCILAR